ncbi:carboxylic ester hydrolase, partial [Trichonephila clavata]
MTYSLAHLTANSISYSPHINLTYVLSFVEIDVDLFGENLNNSKLGSYHESELYYIFGFPHMNLSNALRLPQDKEVSNIMIQLWSDFAKHGNPTPERKDEDNMVKNFTWRPYTEEEDCFATLGMQPFVARSYESERMTFWNHFVPLFTEYPIFNFVQPYESCKIRSLRRMQSDLCGLNLLYWMAFIHCLLRLAFCTCVLVKCTRIL